ncbi:MAG: DDE-type integrase/transposase/recombinase [Treponema sp.]|jgi:hypothetical protein|nr:DDE-type integrase/transposase/recombinase [Treponema sp.]
MGLTMPGKNALTNEVSKRYQKAKKKEKTLILNEFVQNTGYNRKYALHKLVNWGKAVTVRIDGETVKLKSGTDKRRKGGGRKPIYTGGFPIVLQEIWVFFWYRCGKILAPFIREHIQFLETPFRITPEIKELLLKASPSTIDRVLRAEKKKLTLKGKRGTKPGKLLKKHIPIRTYFADADKKCGFFEFDTVHHCGISESGEFCLTLTATDVYSGWVELRPLLNKAHKWVFQALADIRASLPFPLQGMDSDNGSEFINNAVLKWCQEHKIQFTRTRPYHKNDNCYVEQKNNSAVRNFIGYERFTEAAERDALAAVYRSLCPLLNYFIPTQKLLSKTRVGANVKKVYDKKIVSPYQRLLASPDLTDDVKTELTRRFEQYDPVKLQKEVHGAVDTLMKLNKKKELLGLQALALAAPKAV